MARKVTRVANHAEVAHQLHARPYMWGTVGVYPSAQVAAGTAHDIKSARGTFRVYGPAGYYEARTTPVEDGTLVEARYTGGTSRPQPVGQVRPSLDTERVLGQIARDEMWCGPDAARTIAARHEQAYGAAWQPAPAVSADAAWADALAALGATTPAADADAGGGR